MTKQEARARMKRRRQELGEEERRKRNQRILENVIYFLEKQGKEWFFPFVSYGTEADTKGLITYVLQNTEMKVAVPRVEQCAGNEQEGRMEFYRITSLAELKTGFQGIPEPVGKNPVIAADGVMLLPGLAFDRMLHRVGYGGGYYDRYLERCDSAGLVTAAAAFDFQIVEQIESEQYDISPQWLITDSGIFHNSITEKTLFFQE